MRILVFGAGVLGCNLARNLFRAGKDVTLFARGNWAEKIRTNGLQIKDKFSFRMSVSRIPVVTELKPEDRYDVIFVVLRCTQLDTILETLQEMLPDGDPRKKLVSKDLITYVTDRKGHDRRYAIAPDKIKEEIGWYPETMFKDGIRLTIQWFFEHEDWMKNVTSGDYQKYYEEMYKNK